MMNYIIIYIIFIGLVYLLLINPLLVIDESSRVNLNFKEIQDMLMILVRQVARWSAAAAQDNNPMIALLHSNYGVAYMNLSKEYVKAYSSIEYDMYINTIGDIESKTIKDVEKKCDISSININTLSLTNKFLDKNIIIKAIIDIIHKMIQHVNNTDIKLEKVIYSNYATGYLWAALKDIFTDNDIQATGYDPFIIRDRVIFIQDDSTRLMINTCQKFRPN